MIITKLQIPDEWECDGSIVMPQLERCTKMLNDVSDYQLQLRYIASWIRCMERLIGLGHKTSVAFYGSSKEDEYSFDWSACGMVGGMIFFEDSGWSLHT